VNWVFISQKTTFFIVTAVKTSNLTTTVCFCREHKLTWCPIYKAASSTWMYNLCLLAGHTEEYIAENHKQIKQLARDAFPELDGTSAEEVSPPPHIHSHVQATE
jgi:hypothetical protein